jgi:hypothetical protein
LIVVAKAGEKVIQARLTTQAQVSREPPIISACCMFSRTDLTEANNQNVARAKLSKYIKAKYRTRRVK